MRGNQSNVIMAGRRFGDYPILVAGCEAVHETVLMACQKNVSRIIIQSDSQCIINAIIGKTCIQKDKINLVEHMTLLIPHFSDSKLE